ncbi:hypothetical protein EV175_004349 [Coemansia sp. RSA 1933]|nr:hypothetical protein EV175_004349 [Coemansia sp. RSA 1933]
MSTPTDNTLEYHQPTDHSNSIADRSMVIVTRVGSWLGAETALRLIRNGVTVVGVGEQRDRVDKLQTAAQQHGCHALFLPVVGQLTDAHVHDAVVQHIETHSGRLRLAALVVNVGAFEGIHIGNTEVPPFEQWIALQRSLVEPMPLFHSLRHHLRKHRARVVHVASIDELHNHLPRHVSLIAIKTAVNMLTAEVAIIEPRITSLAVHPSFSALEMALTAQGDNTGTDRDAAAAAVYCNASSTDHLKPASDLIADLAINADRSMSGKFFMYSESSFP